MSFLNRKYFISFSPFYLNIISTIKCCVGGATFRVLWRHTVSLGISVVWAGQLFVFCDITHSRSVTTGDGQQGAGQSGIGYRSARRRSVRKSTVSRSAKISVIWIIKIYWRWQFVVSPRWKVVYLSDRMWVWFFILPNAERFARSVFW